MTAFKALIAALNLVRYFDVGTSNMLDSHSMESVFFGLLHVDGPDLIHRWNTFDGRDARDF